MREPNISGAMQAKIHTVDAAQALLEGKIAESLGRLIQAVDKLIEE